MSLAILPHFNPQKKSQAFYCTDGPESVHILGPEEGRTGDTLTLECTTADSNPPVDVWWVVDGRAVQVHLIHLTYFTVPGIIFFFVILKNIVNSLRHVCSILYLLISFRTMHRSILLCTVNYLTHLLPPPPSCLHYNDI
jgi:hypothetical protein